MPLWKKVQQIFWRYTWTKRKFVVAALNMDPAVCFGFRQTLTGSTKAFTSFKGASGPDKTVWLQDGGNKKKREESTKSENRVMTYRRGGKRVTNILMDNFARIVFPLNICACELTRNGMRQELYNQLLQASREKCCWEDEIGFTLNYTWFLATHPASKITFSGPS